MQNGRADRIERSVAILSPNRVCSRSGLLIVLAVPTHLEVHTKLISTPPPPRLTSVKYVLHKAISTVLVISFLARIHQLKWNATLQPVSAWYNRTHPPRYPCHRSQVEARFSCPDKIGIEADLQAEAEIHPRFQSDCSVRAPPI